LNDQARMNVCIGEVSSLGLFTFWGA
jgi:hypothetical protein